jgi:hypothetical protein
MITVPAEATPRRSTRAPHTRVPTPTTHRPPQRTTGPLRAAVAADRAVGRAPAALERQATRVDGSGVGGIGPAAHRRTRPSDSTVRCRWCRERRSLVSNLASSMRFRPLAGDVNHLRADSPTRGGSRPVPPFVACRGTRVAPPGGSVPPPSRPAHSELPLARLRHHDRRHCARSRAKNASPASPLRLCAERGFLQQDGARRGRCWAP